MSNTNTPIDLKKIILEEIASILNENKFDFIDDIWKLDSTGFRGYKLIGTPRQSVTAVRKLAKTLKDLKAAGKAPWEEITPEQIALLDKVWPKAHGNHKAWLSIRKNLVKPKLSAAGRKKLLPKPAPKPAKPKPKEPKVDPVVASGPQGFTKKQISDFKKHDEYIRKNGGNQTPTAQTGTGLSGAASAAERRIRPDGYFIWLRANRPSTPGNPQARISGARKSLLAAELKTKLFKKYINQLDTNPSKVAKDLQNPKNQSELMDLIAKGPFSNREKAELLQKLKNKLNGVPNKEAIDPLLKKLAAAAGLAGLGVTLAKILDPNYSSTDAAKAAEKSKEEGEGEEGSDTESDSSKASGKGAPNLGVGGIKTTDASSIPEKAYEASYFLTTLHKKGEYNLVANLYRRTRIRLAMAAEAAIIKRDGGKEQAIQKLGRNYEKYDNPLTFRAFQIIDRDLPQQISSKGSTPFARSANTGGSKKVLTKNMVENLSTVLANGFEDENAKTLVPIETIHQTFKEQVARYKDFIKIEDIGDNTVTWFSPFSNDQVSDQVSPEITKAGTDKIVAELAKKWGLGVGTYEKIDKEIAKEIEKLYEPEDKAAGTGADSETSTLSSTEPEVEPSPEEEEDETSQAPLSIDTDDGETQQTKVSGMESTTDVAKAAVGLAKLNLANIRKSVKGLNWSHKETAKIIEKMSDQELVNAFDASVITGPVKDNLLGRLMKETQNSTIRKPIKRMVRVLVENKRLVLLDRNAFVEDSEKYKDFKQHKERARSFFRSERGKRDFFGAGVTIFASLAAAALVLPMTSPGILIAMGATFGGMMAIPMGYSMATSRTVSYDLVLNQAFYDPEYKEKVDKLRKELNKLSKLRDPNLGRVSPYEQIGQVRTSIAKLLEKQPMVVRIDNDERDLFNIAADAGRKQFQENIQALEKLNFAIADAKKEKKGASGERLDRYFSDTKPEDTKPEDSDKPKANMQETKRYDLNFDKWSKLWK